MKWSHLVESDVSLREWERRVLAGDTAAIIPAALAHARAHAFSEVVHNYIRRHFSGPEYNPWYNNWHRVSDGFSQDLRLFTIHIASNLIPEFRHQGIRIPVFDARHLRLTGVAAREVGYPPDGMAFKMGMEGFYFGIYGQMVVDRVCRAMNHMHQGASFEGRPDYNEGHRFYSHGAEPAHELYDIDLLFYQPMDAFLFSKVMLEQR